MKPYNVRDYWTNVAENIARRPGDKLVAGLETPFYAYKREKFVAAFLGSIPAAGKDVLELGCGPGGNLIELAKLHPSRLVGCDISPSMIDLASKATAGLDGIELVPTDGKTLPFGDQEFAITYTATVLQHNYDEQMRQVAAEICRVTREAIYLFEDTATRRKKRYSVILRPVGEYASVFGRHGFEVVETQALRVFASERTAGVLRRVLSRRPPSVGEPVSGLTRELERAVLPVTRRLDQVVGQPQGLTKIVLHRRA